MNKKQKLLLCSLALKVVFFASNADAQKLNYSVSSGSGIVQLAICDKNGKCVSNSAGIMETGNVFCIQNTFMMPVHSIYKIIDTSQPANITYSINEWGNDVVSNLENATLVANTYDGNCPNMDPSPDGEIAYQIHNQTSRPIRYLKVFTTENNGSEPCNGCSYWHIDNSTSLPSGTKLEPDDYFPRVSSQLGKTAWFDKASNTNGTRWFITYGHGNDCFSTTFYNNSGIYSDQSNLCDYTSDDLNDQKYRPAALNIVDYNGGGAANILLPTLQRSCNITISRVDLKYCKNQ